MVTSTGLFKLDECLIEPYGALLDLPMQANTSIRYISGKKSWKIKHRSIVINICYLILKIILITHYFLMLNFYREGNKIWYPEGVLISFTFCTK